MRAILAIGLLTGLAVVASPVNAQVFEDLEAIDQRAAMIAGLQGYQAVAVDRRIKLPRCPEAAVIEAADVQSLAARCLPLGWRMRIALTPASGAASFESGATAPLVKRGDPLRLRVQGNGFMLVYSVVAAANGRVGEVIPVRAEGSKAILRAQLIGPGQAMLVD